MSAEIQAPNKRLDHVGKSSGVFVTDIVNATENLLESILNIAGVPNPGFAILSGFDYSYTGYDVYGAGWFIWNGNVYYSAGFNSSGGSKWLVPVSNNILPKNDSDAVARDTYTTYTSTTTTSNPDNGGPQFIGDMSQYHIDLTTINNRVTPLTIFKSNINKVTLVVGSGFDWNQLFPLTPTRGNLFIVRDLNMNTCTIICDSLLIHPDNLGKLILTLPVGYRPARNVDVLAIGSIYANFMILAINTLGQVVYTDSFSTYSEAHSFSITYSLV